jgi:hypothetical protein
MNSKLASTMLAVSALAIGCQPTPQSNADTTAATSSSTVQTLGGASAIDTVAAPGTLGAGSKTTKPVSSTSKSGSKIKSDPLADPSIRGRDSVIRFPLKTLPTASSTPTRE